MASSVPKRAFTELLKMLESGRVEHNGVAVSWVKKTYRVEHGKPPEVVRVEESKGAMKEVVILENDQSTAFTWAHERTKDVIWLSHSWPPLIEPTVDQIGNWDFHKNAALASGSVYLHGVSGNVYKIDSVALHSDTNTPYVLYHSLVNPEPRMVWARPYADFFGTVNVLGDRVPRFYPIE